MNLRKPNHWSVVILLATVNVFISIGVSQAQNVTGSVGIINCSDFNCLELTIPAYIPPRQTPTEPYGGTPHFLTGDGEKISIVFNYPLGQEFKISDSRPSGGFTIDMDMTDLENITDNTYKIPKTSIGILSFNSNPIETISLDNAANSTAVYSTVDPDLLYPDHTNLSYQDIVDHGTTSPISDWYTAIPASGGITLIQTPNNPTGWRSIFTMGMAFLIEIPADPELTLRDGIYTSTITFTLTA